MRGSGNHCLGNRSISDVAREVVVVVLYYTEFVSFLLIRDRAFFRLVDRGPGTRNKGQGTIERRHSTVSRVRGRSNEPGKLF